MIKKTALSTLLLCTSGLVIAEDVPPNQTEAVTKLESMQVRAEPDSGYAVSNSSSATRTDTPIKQIPQSIQVLPHQLIDDQQNVTVSEALKNVSGVVANDELATPAFETTRIRGFKAEHLVDGFSQYYNTGDRESLVNVEKIEVLKGANSILHSGGAGSPVGGVINVTSKLPQAKAFGELGIKFGTNSFFQPFFDINQPLSPNALFRVTGEFTTSGSDIALLDQNRYNVNPTLTLTDGKDTTLTLQGKLSHWAQQEYQGLPAVGTVAGNFRIKRDLFIGENNIPDTTADFKGIWATLDHKINDMWSFNVKARYAESQFDEQTQLIFSNAPDMPPSTWAFGNTQMQQTQKEHSFMANAKAKFDWGMTKNTVLFGVDYTEIRDTGVMNSDAFLAFNLIDLANPVFSVPYIAPPTSPFTSMFNSVVNNTTFGGFFQWQSTIYDRLHVVAGVRLAHVGVDYFEGTSGNQTRTDKDKVLPRLGAVFDINNYFSVFASYSEGLRGQSFSIFKPGVKPAPAESSNFETGIKFDVNSKIVGQMAFYQIERNNVAVGFPATPMGNERSRGFETDMTWHPTSAWSLLANYAYTDARFTNNVNASTRAGSPVQGVPEHSTRIWANYNFQQEMLKGLSLGLGANWQSGAFVENNTQYKSDSYYTMDATAAYQTERFKLAVSVKNLTGENYYQFYDYFGGRVRPDTGTNAYLTASFKY